MIGPNEKMRDFLYADHERVASFLAQISDEGVQTSSEQSRSNSEIDEKRAGSDLKIISGAISKESQVSLQIRETYDPLWRNSLKLIKYVEDNSHSNEISIGKIRISSGKLLAYNLEMLFGLFAEKSMEDFIADGISDTPQNQNRSAKVKRGEKAKEAAVIRSYLANLPLGIGFVLVADDAHFWFGVEKEYLSLNEFDIPLKFPTHISGVWNVLGIIDAKDNDVVTGMQDVLDKNIDGLLPRMPLELMQLTGITAGMFGRPMQACGLSPLVIYREVSF